MEPYRGRGMPDLPWKGGCGFQAPPGPPLSSCSPSSSWTSWARTAVLLIWSLLVGMIWGLLAGVGAVLSAVAAIVRAPIARRRSEPAQPSRLVRLGAASVGLAVCLGLCVCEIFVNVLIGVAIVWGTLASREMGKVWNCLVFPVCYMYLLVAMGGGEHVFRR